MPDLDLTDIQGLVLRGYSMPLQRHFILRVHHAREARRLLGKLTGGDASVPQITNAETWTDKPASVLSIGITAEGLKALGLSAETLATFPEAFLRGSGHPVTAQKVGYTGESAPENWIDALAWKNGAASNAHVLLFLAAQDETARDTVAAALKRLLAAEESFELLAALDGAELPESRVHFGYIDGISQPRIAGAPPSKVQDDQPTAPAGEFLLGYESQFSGFQYPVPTPETLGRNGTFAAYGVLKQDVVGFEAFLKQAASTSGKSEEWVAAKMCGRWRNGVPLSLSPDTDSPDPPLPFEQWNAFDFTPTSDFPDLFDDSRGVRCPIGSHIRRSHPRGGRVAGDGGRLHRLLRRGIPYGPVFDPQNPADGIERGLLGMFLGVSLKDQFEFLMAEWINGDAFGLLGDLDPLAGNNSSGTQRLRIPLPDVPKPLTLTGLSRFVTTRGSAYCFLPSLTSLRTIAAL